MCDHEKTLQYVELAFMLQDVQHLVFVNHPLNYSNPFKSLVQTKLHQHIFKMPSLRGGTPLLSITPLKQ